MGRHDKRSKEIESGDHNGNSYPGFQSKVGPSGDGGK